MNTQIIKNHIKFLTAFIAFCLSFTAYSQPPICDTCHYDVDVTFNPIRVIPYVLTESADTGEYMPCGTGVLIKKNTRIRRKLQLMGKASSMDRAELSVCCY